MPKPVLIELSAKQSSAAGLGIGLPPEPEPPRGRQWQPLLAAAPPLAALFFVAVGILLLPAGLSAQARAALFAFAFSVVLWSMTKLPAAWVALASVLLLILLGGARQEVLFTSLASDVVWLMIGAFVLGGAVQQTGLAGRLTGLVARRANSVNGVFWLVTLLLVPLSVLIPSTSGRAAVMVPVYRALTAAADDRRISRALALLIPTVILVSTISTLVGAGSHLVANDLLEQVSGERISFARWALYGVPFGLVASLVACGVILRMFLDSERRARRLSLPRAEVRSLSRREVQTMAIVAAMVGMWMTESLHGIEIAVVAVAGAVLLSMPHLGVMSWKDSVKAVTWNLVLFVGAALVLGEALIETGAAQWIVERLFALSGVAGASSSLFVLVALAMLTLTSHVYMTSHAARAAALVPAVLYLGETLDLSPVAMMFIGTVGMDYCLTFPVSSKALLLFAELDDHTFEPPDLLRLSAVLLLVHVVLMVVFYYGYWQFVGLAL